MDEELLTTMLSNSEETIMTYIIEERFEEAVSEIETMVDQLEDL
jgi:exonuclease VII small subunit